MNPLPLLFLISAAGPSAAARTDSPHAGRTQDTGSSRPRPAPLSLPPVDVLADRLHSLTAAVDQMASLSRTLQNFPGLAIPRSASTPLPTSTPLQAMPQPTAEPLPQQAVPFSGPPEAFGPSLSAMAQKLPSNIGQLLTPDLLQKVSALLGK